MVASSASHFSPRVGLKGVINEIIGNKVMGQ